MRQPSLNDAGRRHGKGGFGSLKWAQRPGNVDLLGDVDDEQFVDGPALLVARRADKRTRDLPPAIGTPVTRLADPAIACRMRNLVASWFGIRHEDHHEHR